MGGRNKCLSTRKKKKQQINRLESDEGKIMC